MGRQAFWIGHNAKLLRELLENAQPKASVFANGRDVFLSIEPRSLSGLSLEGLHLPELPETTNSPRISMIYTARGVESVVQTATANETNPSFTGLLRGFRIFDGLDATLEREPRTYHLHLRFPRPLEEPRGQSAAPSLALKNQITGERMTIPLTRSNTPAEVAQRLSSVTLVSPSVQTVSMQFPALRLYADKTGAVHVPRGHHVLREDAILPIGQRVVFDAGASIQLGAGVSLLVRGGLVVAGTQKAPVTIRPLHPQQPFGTVAALGDSHTECDITHLDIAGGNESHLLGAHYSGQLSLYHHKKVTLRDSKVGVGRADDGANIKYAEVDIRTSEFTDNFADQLDLDVVTGTVRDSTFRLSQPGSPNADGLDSSFSRARGSSQLFLGAHGQGNQHRREQRCVSG